VSSKQATSNCKGMRLYQVSEWLTLKWAIPESV
jgi:hypothetical protein